MEVVAAERAIAPFDLSGLWSPPERVIRHLLAAHHDGVQFAYDLELLALWPGRLAELRDAVAEIVEHDTPRARWLRDLVVFDGYHEALLDAVDRVMRGEELSSATEANDPDLSLRAYLRWCARRRQRRQPLGSQLQRKDRLTGAHALTPSRPHGHSPRRT
jgi:hypothetical protein